MEACEKTCHGIYFIKNILTNDLYIGSAVNLRKRSQKHIRELNYNRHHSIILQNSWNKNGSKEFVFEVLEMVYNKENLLIREQFYLDTLKPRYNICPNAGSHLGKKASEETRKKMSESKKGEKAPWFGKKLPDSAKEKNRLWHTDKKASKETKNKMSASQKIRYIEKDSPCKGRIQPKEERKKRSKIGKKTWSDEKLKQQHSIRIKEWWAERKKKLKN
jgi:excinuclease UvrABC nuclease subunit